MQNIEEWTLFVAIATAATSVAALISTICIFKKQLRLQFFADYTKRYQEIILNLPAKIDDSDFSLDSLTQEERDKTLRYMRAYFDLCSEEYFLWKNSNISNKNWKEWESGIYFAFSKPAFQQAWRKLRVHSIYHGDFTDFIEKNPDKT